MRIPIGLGESLVFRETTHAPPPFDGHYVQIAAVVAEFPGVHRHLLERGLTTEESNESQYRFQDITDLDTGAVLVIQGKPVAHHLLTAREVPVKKG